jgi:sialate O-acetylesterase
MMHMKRLAMGLMLIFAAWSTTSADVKLPAIFGDHMVIQRGMKVPVWGTASPGEKVIVKCADRQASATADERGKWRVSLDPIEATDPVEMTIDAKNTITIHDALVGEVWLCGGQSNMTFELKNAANGAEAMKSADRPTMRLFIVGRIYPETPTDEVKGKWVLCSPETVKDFSAVGYFFGNELGQKMNVPVGLIESAWGGTRAEAWMPRATFDALKLPYEPAWTQEWLNPKPTRATTQPIKRPHEAPAVLYNGMIAPIAGYAMRGVIWYQGETNTAYAEKYRDVLTAMIGSWRAAWGQGDFPFLIVQLANLQNTRFWPTLREAQVQVAREVPNCGLAVTIDIGNPKNIHPTDKQTVGHRLAVVAEKVAYGKDVAYSGPVVKSVRADGSRAVVEFDHVDGGLAAKGDLLGFEVAGADGKFVPATATIDGDRVILTGVDSPRSVRYAWANDPKCTLYNKADLPAVPFDATVK